MKALTREAILAAEDLPRQRVEVPEWGGYLYVTTMSGEARDWWELQILGADYKSRNLANTRAKLVAATAVDEQGERLFTDSDVAALGRKSARALDRVYDAAVTLNALREQDIAELAGNSASDHSAGGS